MSAARPSAYERERQELRAHWVRRFRDHVATLATYSRDDGRAVEELRWAKPGTGIEAVTYHSVGPRLVVTGDLYDAIYVREEGLRWWSTVSWDYFAEKCVASPIGRGFKSWDEEHATANVKYHLAEGPSGRRSYFRLNEGWRSLCSAQDWQDWLREHGTDAFGADWYELGSIGMTVDWVCKAHLFGLKLAFEQLDAKAAAA